MLVLKELFSKMSVSEFGLQIYLWHFKRFCMSWHMQIPEIWTVPCALFCFLHTFLSLSSWYKKFYSGYQNLHCPEFTSVFSYLSVKPKKKITNRSRYIFWVLYTKQTNKKKPTPDFLLVGKTWGPISSSAELKKSQSLFFPLFSLASNFVQFYFVSTSASKAFLFIQHQTENSAPWN